VPSACVVVAYFVLGLIAYGPALPHISSRLFTTLGDFSLWIWSMAWTTHAVTHGLNPFFSNALFVPTGLNLGDNTSAPLLSFLTTPTSWLWGPIVSANLVTIVAMPVSATSAFFVLRKWRVGWPAAALGGLAYGFSPYMIGQATGHPQLLFVPIPPLIALSLTRVVRRSGSPTRLGIELGLLVAAQFLISPEILATIAIFAAVALVYLAIRRMDIVREGARSMARSFAVAALTAAPIIAYPVWMMLAGPEHFVGSTIAANNPYHNDLWSSVIPGPLQQVFGRQLPGDPGFNYTESGGYVGIAVVVAVVVFVWRGRRTLRMQLGVLLLFTSLLLALGPHLQIGGHLTAFPLPFLVLDHLPLLDNILPSRINFEAGVCVAAVLAFGLDDMHNRLVRVPRHRLGIPKHSGTRLVAAAAAVVVLVAVVLTQLPRWPYPSQPASVLPTAIRQAVPPGDPVAITFPYVTTHFETLPLVWQAEDGFAFRMLGGYGYHPGSGGKASTLPSSMNPPQLQDFLVAEDFDRYSSAPTMTPRLLAEVRQALDVYRVRLVIVDGAVRGGDHVTSLFTSALGPPKVSSDEFHLWADWSR
jgi:hypothetical protein